MPASAASSFPHSRVSTSVRAAANSIREHSFALLRLSPRDDNGNDGTDGGSPSPSPPSSAVSAEAIRVASTVARDYFQNTTGLMTVAEKIERHRVVCNGNLLLGFSVPSKAKHLFRAYVAGDTGDPHHSCQHIQQQPWPNKSFEVASRTVAAHLHRILIDCWRALDDETKECDESATPSVPPFGKRRKISPTQVEPSSDKPSSSASSDRFRGKVNPCDCPLDYFYYHNEVQGVVNCSAHVDRGVLICVCLTPVAGLEVLVDSKEVDQGEGSSARQFFFCPEEEMQQQKSRSGSEERNHDDGGDEGRNAMLCIMAGDSLRQFYPGIPACVHQVRNDLETPRLSISYELRLTSPSSS